MCRNVEADAGWGYLGITVARGEAGSGARAGALGHWHTGMGVCLRDDVLEFLFSCPDIGTLNSFYSLGRVPSGGTVNQESLPPTVLMRIDFPRGSKAGGPRGIMNMPLVAVQPHAPTPHLLHSSVLEILMAALPVDMSWALVLDKKKKDKKASVWLGKRLPLISPSLRD